jgi:mRNA-degrading endonuclease RelE of RelBE toxin-antitoxin system
MLVIFLNSFKKDLKKINDKSLKQKVKKLIINIETAENLFEVENIIKMAGFNMSYRAKIDSYRLGFYSYDTTIELARFVKRNDIYKVFPNKNKDKPKNP